MDGPTDDAAFARLALLDDVQAIGRALLDREGLEARFRTGLLVTAAEALGLAGVVGAAETLRDRLGPPGTPHPVGVGPA